MVPFLLYDLELEREGDAGNSNESRNDMGVGSLIVATEIHSTEKLSLKIKNITNINSKQAFHKTQSRQEINRLLFIREQQIVTSLSDSAKQ